MSGRLVLAMSGARRALPAACLVVLLACAATSRAAEGGMEARRAAAVSSYDHDIAPLLTTWCGECHRAEKHKGDVDFSTIRGGAAALGERELWGNVATKLALQEMPPEKAKQPSDDERARIAGWITSLRRLDPPDPGVMGVRRLARQEYVNTIRDLFIGYSGDPGQGFPSDQIGAGFNNSLSPLLMEKMLLASDGVLDQIIASDHVEMHWSAVQLDAVVDGKEDAAKGDADKAKGGSRTFAAAGHLTATLSLPEAGTYTIRVRAGADQAGKEPVRLMIGLDGALLGEIAVLARTKMPVAYTCKAKLPAGPGHLTVTFINPATEPATLTSASGKAKPGDVPPKPQVRAVTIESVDLIGPPAAKQSDAQRRLFVAQPGKDLDKRTAARRIIEAFAARAFRRPADADEIDGLLKVFDLADTQGEVFSEAVKLMLKATLLSPQFLFRLAEDGDQGAPVGGMVAVDSWGMASRLSYFLWSSMPDDELFAAARDGKLADPAAVAAQVRRMLKDPKAHALIDNFAVPWLGLGSIQTQTIDQKRFPHVTPALRQAMADEPLMLVEAVMREDRSLLELLDCRYTFLNQALAEHYGISGVSGTQMRKVELSDPLRGGVMTTAAVLMVTSTPTRTSP
ncbi:MAG: DUF1592 domain-containing protein, partial [Planctomycetes bacterium]|nr:DUF1592 domain-containing protein [Planctomycetota bacterium]